MLCFAETGGYPSVCGGEIDILGNRKQLKRGERVRIEGRLVSKIYRTGIYQKIEADEVMRI